VQGCVSYVPFVAGNRPGDFVLGSLNAANLAVASQAPNLTTIPPYWHYNSLVYCHLIGK